VAVNLLNASVRPDLQVRVLAIEAVDNS